MLFIAKCKSGILLWYVAHCCYWKIINIKVVPVTRITPFQLETCSILLSFSKSFARLWLISLSNSFLRVFVFVFTH